MRVRELVHAGLAMAVMAWGMRAEASDECLVPGYEANSAGEFETAIRLYRNALARPACQAPDIEPLVRFSLAGTLTSYAEVSPLAACDAAEELRAVVRIADDPDVADTAAKALPAAEAACAVAQWPVAPAPAPPVVVVTPIIPPAPIAGPSMAPPPMAQPQIAATPSETAKDDPSAAGSDRQPSLSDRPRQMSEPPRANPSRETARFRVGIRTEAGVTRLAGFESKAVDVVPGPALRAALVLEWRLRDRLHARIEPGVAWQTARFETNSDWQEAVFANGETVASTGAWRWWLVELPLIVRIVLSGGFDMSAGASGALVLSADESDGVFGDEIARLGDSGRGWSVEASLGIGYGWAVEDQRMRIELRAAQGLVGVNTGDDVIGLRPQRLALGLEVAF